MPNKVLIIGLVWPEPNSSAAGTRMMQLVDFFVTNGDHVTFSSAASDSEHAADFSSLGIEKKPITLNSSSFDDFIQKLQPNIVVYDRFMIEEQFGWRVREHCPDALQILDTEDLHCLRSARHKALKKGEEFKERLLVSEDISKRELASIYRSDLSLIISRYEMEILTDFFKVDESLLCYLPFMLENVDDTNWLTFGQRKHFVSIGNFLHAPNMDAVLFLKEEIWPSIRARLPEAELHVYGAYPSERVEQLHDIKNGFIVKGRTESAQDVVRHSKVLLAPLRFGAGLKGKLVEAMQCGTPSVTTSIGAEAMHGEFDWAGLIGNSSQEIVDAAVTLYSDKAEWRKAQENGAEIIRSCYPKSELSKKLLHAMVGIRENLGRHREHNFIGAMLTHHSLASTKYMARWIEEKNK